MRLPSVPSDNRFRVLVVEDDPSIAHLLSVHLKKASFQVFIARDGMDGLNQFSLHDPHLLLTDIYMPGLSGLELVERVRTQSAVPILMMTASDSEDAQMKGFKIGADDYICKPFNPALLTARIIANLRRVYRYDNTTSPASAPSPAPASSTPFSFNPNDLSQPQMAARPTTVPSVNLPDVEIPSIPPGFVRCDSCGYMGPTWKFDARDRENNKIVQCPNCKDRSDQVD